MRCFIVNFNDEYYLDQDFTANVNKLREALERLKRGAARRSMMRWLLRRTG